MAKSKTKQPKTPGEIAKERRLKLKKTLIQVAVAAGLSDDTVSDFERGVLVPHQKTIAKLARALDLAPELLKGPQ